MTGILTERSVDRTRLISLLLLFAFFWQIKMFLRMEKKETAKQKKVQDLISNLSANDTKTVVKAIKALKTNGDETSIEPLISLLSKTDSEPIKKEIVDLLNTIKSTAVPPALIACLNNPDYVNARQAMMVSIWSTALNYNQYFGEIAQATVNGDLMEAIECITILENLEEGLNEDELMDGILIFKSYLVDKKAESSPKNDIIMEIVQMLQQMNDTV